MGSCILQFRGSLLVTALNMLDCRGDRLQGVAAIQRRLKKKLVIIKFAFLIAEMP